MSRGFVKEYEDEWLHEIAPSMNSLLQHLTRESNGIPIYEKRAWLDDETGKEIHEMSNGLKYTLNEENKWCVLD